MSDEQRPGGEGQDPDRPPRETPEGGEGGGGEGDAPEAEGPPPVPRCQVCGAELEPDQTYCLECGSPTPLAPRLRRGSRALALLAGAIVVLGAGAGALAYAVASDGDGDGAGGSSAPNVTAPTTSGATVAPPLTGPLPPDTSVTSPTAPATAAPAPGTSAATGFETVTGPTSSAPPTETAPAETEPPATETDPDTGGGSDWPAGETAWTAVLSSVRRESDARAAKARLAASGEPAGVLFSSDYPGLRPGYWVVFSGTYPGKAAAEAQARELSARFPGAYARRIEG